MRRGVVFSAAYIFAACGEPLLPEGFRGEPILQFEGLILQGISTDPLKEELSAAIFWSIEDGVGDHPRDLVEQTSIEVGVRFPAVFTINVFDIPRDPRLAAGDPAYELGRLLVYSDLDRDGAMSEGELRGGAPLNAFLYLAEDLPADRSPTVRPLDAGFHIVDAPQPCDVGLAHTSTAPGEDCGVPLGAACGDDGDCGRGGYCDRMQPGGYCVLFESTGCAPAGAAPALQQYETFGGPEQGFAYLAGCERSSECREAEGYECAAWASACMPVLPVLIAVDPGYRTNPFCLDGSR
jgi:hypothetical protein